MNRGTPRQQYGMGTLLRSPLAMGKLTISEGVNPLPDSARVKDPRNSCRTNAGLK